MYYHTNELSVELPEIITDRSVNVLTVAESQHSVPFQIIINRDVLLNGENLQQCFDRQVAQMTRQTQGFKVNVKGPVPVGKEGMEGLEIESSFKQTGKSFHQIQAMWITQAPKMVVLTLSSTVAINDGHRKLWRQALASVQPASGGGGPKAS